MERLFQTHQIRKSRECAPVWTMRTLDEGGLDCPEQVLVPGVWESHPALANYRGRAVFEQRIVCGGNVRVWFGGVSFQAEVSLDGKPLAEHYGAYTGFEALALNVPEGAHLLCVLADNRFGDHSALHVPNDYYAYGGINRPVVLEEVGDVFLTSVHVTPYRTETGWVAEIEVQARNLAAEPVRAAVEVVLAGQRVSRELELPEDGTVSATFSVDCGNPRPWSPASPTLYTVQAVLWVAGMPVDDLIDRVGFRQVTVEKNRILLNGEPLRLRGFNRHEEYGGFGLAVPPEAMARDLQIMRDLGVNCVRTCHYPNDPRFLDLCDETGMLVWEESHTRGFTEEKMRHPLFMPQLRRCTEEMISQHYNHPAVFIWGCLNECADNTEYGAACYREIFSLMRKLDRSRPVTAALLERPGGMVFGDMDVVSINLYPQWYHNTPVAESLETKMAEISSHGGENKPVIVSEIGAGAIYGNHDPFGQAKWSEERQCRILQDQIKGILGHPSATGLFLWQFADVRVDESWFSGRPRSFNNKGIVDEYRRPKLAYRTVQALFREDTAPRENEP